MLKTFVTLGLALSVTAAWADDYTWHQALENKRLTLYVADGSNQLIDGAENTTLYRGLYRVDWKKPVKLGQQKFDREQLWVTNDCANMKHSFEHVIYSYQGKEIQRVAGSSTQWQKYTENGNAGDTAFRSVCIQ